MKKEFNETFRITPPRSSSFTSTFRRKSPEKKIGNDMLNRVFNESMIDSIKEKMLKNVFLPIFNDMVVFVQPYVIVICILSIGMIVAQISLLQKSFRAMEKVENLLRRPGLNY
jgi:hypothetical protein